MTYMILQYPSPFQDFRPGGSVQGRGADQDHLLLPDQAARGPQGPQGPGLQALLLPAGEPRLRQVLQHVLRPRGVQRHLLCALPAHVQDCQVSTNQDKRLR